MLYETDTYQTIIYDGSAWREYTSSNSPYDLDGTNSVSSRPIYHFDAAKINGIDASGNPSNAGSLTTAWKSVVGDGRYDFVPQTATAKQPTWYSTGENSLPYLDFDGGDDIYNKQPVAVHGPWVWMQVMKADAHSGDYSKWSAPECQNAAVDQTYLAGSSAVLPWSAFQRRANGSAFAYWYPATTKVTGSSTIWTTQSNMDSWATQTRMLLFDCGSRSGGSGLYLDGDNIQGAVTGAVDFYTVMIGYGQGWASAPVDGKVYEMALWQPDSFDSSVGLTTADKNSIIAYVESKYSLSGFTDF
jgi:hypothetical protein